MQKVALENISGNMKTTSSDFIHTQYHLLCLKRNLKLKFITEQQRISSATVKFER